MLCVLATWTFPIHVASAQLNKPKTKTVPSEDYISPDIIIHNNAILSRQNLPALPNTQRSGALVHSQVLGQAVPRRHSARAQKQVSPEVLSVWLSSKLSPLAPYSEQLAQSNYWSTIIGICVIEQ